MRKTEISVLTASSRYSQAAALKAKEVVLLIAFQTKQYWREKNSPHLFQCTITEKNGTFTALFHLSHKA